MTETTNSQPKKSNAGTSTQSKDSHVLPEDIAKAIAYLEYRRLRHKHPHVWLIMTQLPLTKKESQVLDDVLNYMIDYMEDRVWSPQDRLAFDRIYSKNKSLKYWNAGVPSISWEF